MNQISVYLTGADPVNWATAEDFQLTSKMLDGIVKLTNFTSSQVVHSVQWSALARLNRVDLRKKFVIAHIPHDVRYMLTRPEYLQIAEYVNLWIASSRRAAGYLKDLKWNYTYIPYPIEAKTFFPISKADKRMAALKKKFKIPKHTYLIGSFQRDTEGKDLVTPKYIKGPDIFLEMIKILYAKERNICAVLAGPRRFWLIDQLKNHDIPYVYIGKDVDVKKDNIKINTLNRSEVNLLYNLVDVYVVSSRMEGGPKAILEAAATKCKIISTDVGQAPDILNSKQIFHDVVEGAALLWSDISKQSLIPLIQPAYKQALKLTPLNVKSLWQKIYATLEL